MRRKIDCVYMIEAVGLDRIKIGFTTDLIKRLRTIQTSCPAPVRLIAVIRGDRETERWWHDELRPFRAHGEWFHCGPEVAVQFGEANDAELLNEIKREWYLRRFDNVFDIFNVLGDIFVEMHQ